MSLPASPEEGILNVVVESPAGATTKIKWDPQLEAFSLSLSRPLRCGPIVIDSRAEGADEPEGSRARVRVRPAASDLWIS